MNTYYARHNRGMWIDQDTWDYLWLNQKLALHYPVDRHHQEGAPDSRSVDPADYQGQAKGAMRALNTLAAQGGYVCAEYPGHPEVLVGVVAPGTPIDLYEHGLWDPSRLLDGVHSKRRAVLKTLQMSRCRKVAKQDSAVILVGRPRQGTLMRWPRSGEAIAHLVEGRTVPPGWRDLSYDQQEVLCAEFLRTEEAEAAGLPRLAALVLPVGRTMKALDLVGITPAGEKLFVQVTASRLGAEHPKVKTLREHGAGDAGGGGGRLVLFHDGEAVEDFGGGVLAFPLREVFTRFTGTKVGRAWLREALPAAQVSQTPST